MQDRKARSDRWRPEEVVVQEIIRKYEGGMSARQLGFEYKVADVTITFLLKRRGVFIRNRSNAKRTNQIKEDIFDIITEESAYWIGFILADGNVYHPPKRSKQLNIGLAERDWEHLEQFKKFVGSNKKLYYNNGGVFLSIYSNKIVEKLVEYDIVPRKSKIAKVPYILKNNRHFWRGMIDGDGWVGKRMLGLCGTLNIITHFKIFICNLSVEIPDVAIIPKTGCYECRYQGGYVDKLLSAIYPSNSIGLDRKFSVVRGV
ncbi:hypothetical protein LCGC14_0426430 [marine sediment metagenome]|uniref:DOD-type homing endonuclease domain-containing protein n=1 Tax=marine sediment metagenome TaxID=412755 RepID=A0A0F9SPA7_9ZZZZ